MLQKTFRLFLCMAAIAFTACTKDVDIDLPEQQSRLVVNSFFSTDQPLKVNISQSRSILQKLENVKVDNATVEFFEDQVLKGTLPLASTRNGDYIASSFIPQHGKSYNVKVSVPGFESVEATDALLERVGIDALVLDSVYNTYNQAYMYQLRVKFTDNGAAQNYYQLVLYSRYENDFGQPGPSSRECFYTEDPVRDFDIWDNCGGIAFDDNLIQGKSYEIKIPTNYHSGFFHGNGLSRFYFIVELRSVSRAYYEYNRTFYLQKASEFDPLAQPVQVFSNVQNGYGIFAGYVSVKDSIMLE